MTLEDLWQMYRKHLHGYDPDAETELEKAFKTGVWTCLKLRRQIDSMWIEREYEEFKAKVREK